ncbi:MAG: thioredoxin domain-containing protein [Spirulinaceae cyanobacterium]
MIISVSEKNFDQEVLQSPLPVIVEFWAPWCGLCRIISPILRDLQPELGCEFKIAKVNADKNLRLANTYRLSNLPTILLLEKGMVVHRIESFQGREDLQSSLKAYLEALSVSPV